MIRGEYAIFQVTDLLINHANFQCSFYVNWTSEKLSLLWICRNVYRVPSINPTFYRAAATASHRLAPRNLYTLISKYFNFW